MEQILGSIIVACITGGLALIGTLSANKKAAALMDYRLTELEKKVDKHNNLVDRMYAVEDLTNRQADELERVNARLKKLEP